MVVFWLFFHPFLSSYPLHRFLNNAFNSFVSSQMCTRLFLLRILYLYDRVCDSEAGEAGSSSELCHADDHYVGILGSNLWVANSGKRTVVMGTDAADQAVGFCHCHGNKFNYHAFIPRLDGARACLAILFICSRLS